MGGARDPISRVNFSLVPSHRRAQIKWPAQLKQLFTIFSAFSLNREGLVMATASLYLSSFVCPRLCS